MGYNRQGIGQENGPDFRAYSDAEFAQIMGWGLSPVSDHVSQGIQMTLFAQNHLPTISEVLSSSSLHPSVYDRTSHGYPRIRAP